MTRERHLEEPEILATGEDEQSADEVMFLCMPESCKNHTLDHSRKHLCPLHGATAYYHFEHSSVLFAIIRSKFSPSERQKFSP